MTLHELALRDLKKALISLEHALKKPNVTDFEIRNLEQLIAHLKAILVLVEGYENGN